MIIKIESKGNSEFILKGNIVYMSSTKYKKIIKAIFTFELYVIIIRINILISIFIIIAIIINKFDLFRFFIIVYIDSLSLYEYIVKLNIIKTKSSPGGPPQAPRPGTSFRNDYGLIIITYKRLHISYYGITPRYEPQVNK